MARVKLEMSLMSSLAVCVVEKEGKTTNITYVVGSKSFRPDIQKPRQMENDVRGI